MTPSPLPDDPTPPMPMQPEGVGYLASGNTGNPVLDEISTAHASLSPQAQQAIEGAHGALGISSSHSDPALAASVAPSPELAVPGVSRPRGPIPSLSPETPVTIDPSSHVPGAPYSEYQNAVFGERRMEAAKRGIPLAATVEPQSDARMISGPVDELPVAGGTPMADSGAMAKSALDNSNATFSADHAAFPSAAPRSSAAPIPSMPMNPGETELARLRTNGAGVNQIHNSVGRGFAKVADVLGSTFAKGLASNIPGTTAHNLQLQDRAEKEATDERTSVKNAADVAHTGAETDLAKAQIPHVEAETAALGKPKNEFDLFFKQNPNGTVTDFVKQQEAGKDPTSPYQIWHHEPANAGKGYVDFLKEEAAAKPPSNELELYVKTHPDEANPLAGYEHEKQNITAKPLTKDIADSLNANYNTLAKQYKGVPLDQFHEGMTSAEATQVKAAMLGAVAGTQKGQTIVINQGKAADAKAAKQDAATVKAANDVHKRLTAGFDKLVAQSDALDQAINEIGSNAPGQAVGTIKSIVGLAGGQGSGVRITQAELDSLVKARGLADTFGGWVSQLSGEGKMGAHQVAQIRDVLQQAKDKADEKRQKYFDSLKELGSAAKPEDVRDIENRFNEGLMGGKSYTQADVDAAVSAGHGDAKAIESAFKSKGYVKK